MSFREGVLALACAALWAVPLQAQTPVAVPQDSAVASAERAARAFLAQVDSAHWEATYARLAPMLRNATTLAQWRNTVTQAREPYAPLGARTLESLQRGHAMFGADALTLTFSVARKAGGSAHESVVLVPADDAWQIGGYRIRG